MIRRSWKTFLAGMAMAGLSVSGSAFAGGECCTPASCGPDCNQCEEIFSGACQDLTDQLAQMSCCSESSCCAPVSVLECGEDACGEGCLTEDCGSGINFGGWVQMGYHDGVTPNGVTAFDAGSFNNHPHRLNLQQGWLYAEKVADGSCGLDWGFRIDTMYGVDAADTQAFSNPVNAAGLPTGWDTSFNNGQYGWAIPQAYVELAQGDWSVIIGHFYTLVGYEVVPAPNNFFYSHSLTMFNSEPFTHTGAVATYTVDDSTEIYMGWTAGWDTGFARRNDGSNFLGGFSTALGDKVTFTYITTAGEFGARNNGYSHSMVFDVAVSEKVNYVLQSDLVSTNSPVAGPFAAPGEDVGINQYLFYTVDEKIKLGTRVEWWKRDGNSQYAATFGVNIKPMENLIIRPEWRYDWSVPVLGTEPTFGVDAILTF